jgi:hypothetical protein
MDDLVELIPTPPVDELVLPPDAMPLDFLVAVYRDQRQPMARRMRCAIEAAPYFHPKLAVTASIDSKDLASAIEAAIERSGRSLVIDAKPKADPD